MKFKLIYFNYFVEFGVTLVLNAKAVWASLHQHVQVMNINVYF